MNPVLRYPPQVLDIPILLVEHRLVGQVIDLKVMSPGLLEPGFAAARALVNPGAVVVTSPPQPPAWYDTPVS